MSFGAKKTLFYFLLIAVALISACSKEPLADKTSIMWVGTSPTSDAGKTLYEVKLENTISNKNDTYTWIWSVVNLKPGSGQAGSGTAQDLQSWGITLGNCADINQIVGGSTSADGINWKNFSPELTADAPASIGQPLLMFNQGTVKDQKSYYKLVVLKKFGTKTDLKAVYKSGNLTGSGVLTTSGFGCP